MTVVKDLIEKDWKPRQTLINATYSRTTSNDMRMKIMKTMHIVSRRSSTLTRL
jgi:hypothetical protein